MDYNENQVIYILLLNHRIRECVAAKMILIYHEKGESNLADLLTKVLPVERRQQLLRGLMN